MTHPPSDSIYAINERFSLCSPRCWKHSWLNSVKLLKHISASQGDSYKSSSQKQYALLRAISTRSVSTDWTTDDINVIPYHICDRGRCGFVVECWKNIVFSHFHPMLHHGSASVTSGTGSSKTLFHCTKVSFISCRHVLTIVIKCCICICSLSVFVHQ